MLKLFYVENDQTKTDRFIYLAKRVLNREIEDFPDVFWESDKSLLGLKLYPKADAFALKWGIFQIINIPK